ncbi:M20/M25/M40 family metallo-hydrolase [Actinoplanes sp. NPDC049265]|uniref:M20/M25/M40 family metallo-hydrolase n=1 Tax=Actinoplanes sp. NPDC049265 TaxID=3363902 RepID=UPI003712895A
MSQDAIARMWADQVLPSLSELVAIPAVSALYDSDGTGGGQLTTAVEHVRRWALGLGLPGLRAEVSTAPGRAPVLLIDVPATPAAAAAGTALLYGHLDKQPALGAWSEGLGPWTPVLRGDRLYGRGAVDDGYSGYAALTAVAALAAEGRAHGRVVVLLETGEESGSTDLPFYLDRLGARLGDVSLVVGLDSVGVDARRLWLTTSLRGGLLCTVRVSARAGVKHSGIAGGILPDPVRILRALLDRVEDSRTGEVTLPSVKIEIPRVRREQAADLAAAYPLAARLGLADGEPVVLDDDAELILNNTWRAALTVTGVTGLPPAEAAPALQQGTVEARLAFRLPPTASSADAAAEITRALTTDVPHGVDVEVTDVMRLDGWNAPEPAPWILESLTETSHRVFGAPPGHVGVGGGIPFIDMLARRFPAAQFVVTGAAFESSNMHAPDEWLDLPYARKITEAVADLLAAHASRPAPQR